LGVLAVTTGLAGALLVFETLVGTPA